MKKLLVISYHFPPSTEVGGLRAANFVRHLPEFGWAPHVLTLRDDYLERTDHGKLRCADEVKISKAGRMPTLSPLYIKAKRLLKRSSGESDKTPGQAGKQPGRGQSGETFPEKLRRYVLSFWSLPDEQRSWVLPALIQAVSIVRKEKIDCILTSSPPYSVHLVGWLTKLLTGVRWVADFRDPWMTGGRKALYATCDASLKIERWLEKRVVKKADLVVANTSKLHEEFGKAYGFHMPHSHFVCVTNGFDEEFFSAFESVRKESIFTMTYTGTLYFGRTPEPVFQAVHELIGEGHIDARAIRIRLVGHCRHINGRPTESVVGQYALDGVVEVVEPVDYRRAIEMIKASQLALLLAPSQPYQIPAKAYDYIGAGTDILALAEEGATSDLIRSTGTGATFGQTDIAGLKEFILQSMARQHNPRSEETTRAVAMYEIRAIVRKLALHLDGIPNTGKPAELMSTTKAG